MQLYFRCSIRWTNVSLPVWRRDVRDGPLASPALSQQHSGHLSFQRPSCVRNVSQHAVISKGKTTKHLMFAMPRNTEFPNLYSISVSSLQCIHHPPAQASPVIPAPLEWETEWEEEDNCFKEHSKSINTPELECNKNPNYKTSFSIFHKY